MSDASNDKIMGIVPKDRYMYFTYMFLLVAAAGNALFSVFGLIGIHLASAGYGVMVLGLLALILAIVGLTKHKNDFSALEHAHFKYIGFLFIAFFIINIVFGSLYGISFFLGYLCTIILGLAQAVLVWTGYNAWQGGRVITKDNIKSEVQIALKNR